MHQGGGKTTRLQTPNNELLGSSISPGRRSQQRPNSAKLADRSTVRSIFGGKIRSNSARANPEELIGQVVEELDEPASQHKQGCPWQKARSRSRYGVGVTESSSGIMHPKPWGARNPTDIPCFCHIIRDSKESTLSQPYRQSSNPIRPPGKSAKAKIADIVDNFGVFLERRKIRIAENEAPFLMKKLEEKLQRFVDKTTKNTQNKQEQSKKQRNVQSLSPLQHQNPPIPTKSLSREHLIELQKAKMGGQGQANLVGKLESKKYFLELTSEDQVPNNLRNILGNMSPNILHHPHPDKVLIAMDDKQPAYLAALPEDYRHYTMKTIDMDNYTGVQLHHQAENTTLLLASNPALRRGIHQQATPVLQHKSHLSPIGYKARRT